MRELPEIYFIKLLLWYSKEPDDEMQGK